MREVAPKLFVGNQQDFEYIVSKEPGWAVVHACKEPYHRKALGYSGRAAPKTHKEYLMAVRDDRLSLNLVDAEDPKYIRKEIIDAALRFIAEKLDEGKKILVHCNQGASRSVGITLLHLAVAGQIPNQTFSEAQAAFTAIYPEASMAGGMRGFLTQHWEQYMQKR